MNKNLKGIYDITSTRHFTMIYLKSNADVTGGNRYLIAGLGLLKKDVTS
jgi:hypothetical protein